MSVLERQAAHAAQRTAPNFDKLARVYRWMEAVSFGPWLWRCRCAYLAEAKDARRALVLGDGDGRFTARLLRDNPGVRVDAVDISPAMLRALLRRAGTAADRVNAQVADLRAWTPDCAHPAYDLVVTHFFLDCLTTAEVESLARRVREVAAPGARWMVSEFAVPEGWFRSLVARSIVGLLYRAFRWMTGLAVGQLPEYGEALRGCGFERRRERKWLGGLMVSEVWVWGG